MSERGFGISTKRWAHFVGVGTSFIVFLTTAARSESTDNISVVRELAGQVGQIVGKAMACAPIQPMAVGIINRVHEVIQDVGGTDADRAYLTQLFDGVVSTARAATSSERVDCGAVSREITELEQSVFNTPSRPAAAPSPGEIASSQPGAGAAVNAPSKSQTGAIRIGLPAQEAINAVRGVSDTEIRFGIVAPFSGPSQALGREMKIGIEAAFSRVNESGGVNGRLLKLISSDDGYEPSRTLAAVRHLVDEEKVFGFIGNVGTPTTVAALPYVMDHRMLFFGAFTGSNILRHDPPDRYVFNLRASYAEETAAVVRYLLRIRHVQPGQIVVFAQEDAYGDAGFAGVAKAFRSLGLNDAGIVRLGYKRNTIDVDQALASLRARRVPVKAVVMVASYRAAAKFIERTRDAHPDMIYTNVSFVGSTELASELMLLGPRFAKGVVVTQVVPAVGNDSSVVLEYKKALEKAFPLEPVDYVSFEGYEAANVLIEGLRRTGRAVDTEKLIDALEQMRRVDLGIGVPVSFGPSEHQALHKVWGSMLNAAGRYDPIDLE